MQKVVSVQSTTIPLEANHKHSHYSALHHITLLFPTVTGAFQRQDCSVIVTYRERPADSEVKQSIPKHSCNSFQTQASEWSLYLLLFLLE